MTSKNKFGFEPVMTQAMRQKETEERAKKRSVGPMGAAVREAAESLQETTEAKVEQRRKNASDAKAYRAAEAEGRVLARLPVGNVQTDDLPRDRLDLTSVAADEAMEELMSSIKERGQREPIEVYRMGDGTLQLKKGWRRLNALRQLFDQTGDSQFETVVARVSVADEDRISLYIDMVEENVIREDLSFAEMAQLAMTVTKDDRLNFDTSEDVVLRLYRSLHKTKRSYIRSFVHLLEALGNNLQWPKQVGRNLGVDVARKLKEGAGDVPRLRAALSACTSADDQANVLAGFLSDPETTTPKAVKAAKQKFEFHVGTAKVTARDGEFRLVSGRDFTAVPKDVLEQAVAAFEAVLKRDDS